MNVHGGGGGTGTGSGPDGGSARGPAAVGASILAVAVGGAYLAAAPGELGTFPPEFLITAVVLALAFWFPAMRIATPREVLNGGISLLLWLLAWTLVWDLAVSGVARTRRLFDDWWIVYPTGVLVTATLLVIHGAALGGRLGGSEEKERGDDRDRDTDAQEPEVGPSEDPELD